MRASNKKVREWLLVSGYDEIWFKAHTVRNDVVFTQRGTYLATDLWNLFDGICLNKYNKSFGIVFLQMKTNGWAKSKPLKDFAKKYACEILSFNVSNQLKESKGKYKVYVRNY